MNEEFLNRLSREKEIGNDCIVVTLVNAKGSTPQEVGARIIVDANGLRFGTIGGGKLETKSIQFAQDFLNQKESYHFVEWNLQTDVKMTCGGVVGLFFEKVLARSAWKIAVFGAGHVSQELVRLLVKLDCDITCIDPRQEWLDKLPEHFRLKKIQLEDMKSVLKDLSPNTHIVSLTMGHAFDLPILQMALHDHNFPYVGVMGSDSKKRILISDLRKFGIVDEKIEKLFCPIGERMGNNTPYEIALSITTQLLKFRDSFDLK